MDLKITTRQLVEEAEREIETVSAADAITRLGDSAVTVVDLRDIRELYREGKVPGAVHAPRGMLEFWIDPESPYHRDIFATGNAFLFYCQSGLRSALATKTVKDMGLAPIAHIGGGFRAWVDVGGPVKTVEPKKPKQKNK